MQVQVNTDNHVEGREKLIEHVEGVVLDALDRFEDDVTHVEAHLGDVNSSEKSGLESALGKLQDRQRRRPGTAELSADVLREVDDGAPPAT